WGGGVEGKDRGILGGIARYNEEDCRATLGLLAWLHQVRPPDLAWPVPPTSRERSEETVGAIDARHRLREQLVESAEPRSPRWLAGELLEYHHREARPAWGWYFGRRGMSVGELVEDSGSIGGPAAGRRLKP